MKERINDFLTGWTKTRVVSYLLFALSGFILAAAFYMNASIDVLENWRLILPTQSLHAGDTVVVQSIYNKKLNVTGEATRYIECESRPGVFVRYPISVSPANRGTGNTGTGIELKIPANIPSLPATCKITVIIDYEIALWRHVIESNSSHTFTLHPEREPSTDADETQETSQTPSSTESLSSVPFVDSGRISSSLAKNTPEAPKEQRDISQGDVVVNTERQLDPTKATEQPNNTSLLSGLLDFVSNILKGR